jgi:hypothetical protein
MNMEEDCCGKTGKKNTQMKCYVVNLGTFPIQRKNGSSIIVNFIGTTWSSFSTGRLRVGLSMLHEAVIQMLACLK